MYTVFKKYIQNYLLYTNQLINNQSATSFWI